MLSLHFLPFKFDLSSPQLSLPHYEKLNDSHPLCYVYQRYVWCHVPRSAVAPLGVTRDLAAFSLNFKIGLRTAAYQWKALAELVPLVQLFVGLYMELAQKGLIGLISVYGQSQIRH